MWPHEGYNGILGQESSKYAEETANKAEGCAKNLLAEGKPERQVRDTAIRLEILGKDKIWRWHDLCIFPSKKSNVENQTLSDPNFKLLLLFTSIRHKMVALRKLEIESI